MYKNQNQGLVTPKLAPISLVLPKYNIELMKICIIMASYNMDHVKYSYDNIILNYYQFTKKIKSIELEKINISRKKLNIHFLKVEINPRLLLSMQNSIHFSFLFLSNHHWFGDFHL